MATEKNSFRKARLFVIGYFILLVLMLTFVGIMNWLGYKMSDTTLTFALFALLVGSALAALLVWIVRKLNRRWLKLMIASIGTVGIALLIAGIMVTSSLLLLYSIPAQYTMLTSPNGKQAVLLRKFSRNMDAVNARADACRASETNADDDEYVLDDLAYEYIAYPQIGKFFYDSSRPAEGGVEIGCASAAQLMYEWRDDDTLYMYVENAEEYDGGNLELRFDE